MARVDIKVRPKLPEREKNVEEHRGQGGTGEGWERRIKRNGRREIQAAAKGEQVQTWPVRKSLTARGQKLPEGLVHAWKRD